MRLFLSVCILAISIATQAEPIRLYVIESPPLIEKKGEGVSGISGLLGSLVEKKIRAANKAADFEVMWVPWKRALAETSKNKNSLFFPLTRTPEREKEFVWITHLAQLDCWIYAIRSDIKVDSFQDLKKYKVGVLGGSLREAELRKHMGQDSKNVEGMTTDISNYKKLLSGRIDIWVTQAPVMAEAQSQESSSALTKPPVRQLKKLLVQDLWLVGNPAMTNEQQLLVREVFKDKKKRGTKELISTLPLLTVNFPFYYD